MSVEKVSLVLNHSKAKGTDKVVLIGIANHDGDGGAWPSIETLRRYANVAESSVHDAIARLVALGELSVEHNAGGTRSTRADRRSNLYTILVSDGVRSAGPGDGDGVRSAGATGSGQPDPNHPGTIPKDLPPTQDVGVDDPVISSLCALFQKSMVDRGFTEPRVSKSWITAFDRMIRVDKRTPEEIRAVIGWLVKNPDKISEFWRANIQSPVSLRTEWVRMKLQLARIRNSARGSTQERFAQAAEMAENLGSESLFDRMRRAGAPEQTAIGQ